MNARTRLLPFRLAGMDFHSKALVRITKLDFEDVSLKDNGDALVGISVPRHGFPGIQDQLAHSGRSVAKEFFVSHQSIAVVRSFH